MKHAERIAAARKRLDKQRKVLLAALDAGPACVRCIHYLGDWHDLCGHSACANGRFDPPFDGEPWEIATPAAMAREANGPCRPEGRLFEENRDYRPPPPQPAEPPAGRFRIDPLGISFYAFALFGLVAAGILIWSMIVDLTDGVAPRY